MLRFRFYGHRPYAAAHRQQPTAAGRTRASALLLLLSSLLMGCAAFADNTGEVIVPTRAEPQAIQTALVLTEHAPPPGFETISFNPIDANREGLPAWYFEIFVHFEGQYTENGDPADSDLRMQVWEDSVHRARKVVLTFEGDDALSGGLGRVEAVRIENDFYIIDENGLCTQNNEAAQEIATLNAGDIVGGVTLAVPNGASGDVNGYTGYRYGFGREDLNVTIFRQAPSILEAQGGDVWLLPEYNVVGRFATVLNIHNAQVLFGDRPVTGELFYDYNLYDINQTLTIALPNGC